MKRGRKGSMPEMDLQRWGIMATESRRHTNARVKHWWGGIVRARTEKTMIKTSIGDWRGVSRRGKVMSVEVWMMEVVGRKWRRSARVQGQQDDIT